MTEITEPDLSVVIIGRNEGSRLVRCIDSVKAMKYTGRIELIYVDSGSTDDSPARAARLGARVIEPEDGARSAARARNAGWQVSSAPLVFFLDGDTILHPDFVTKALPVFSDPEVMVVCGHRREIHPEASIYNRVCDMDWICNVGETDFCGGDAIIRRTALEQNGGYNADLIAGEEPDLCRRIRAKGGRVIRIDEPMTGHDLEMTSWHQYWKRALRTGHAYAEIAGMYRTSGDPFWTGVSRHNVAQASIYILAPLGAFLAAILTHWWLLALLPVLFGTALVVRTAVKYRHRGSASLGTLLLFGVHSHAQSIPVFIGQVRYWLHASVNHRIPLIEYKKTL